MNKERIDEMVAEVGRGDRDGKWFSYLASNLTEEQDKAIQKRLFELGFKWVGTGVGFWRSKHPNAVAIHLLHGSRAKMLVHPYDGDSSATSDYNLIMAKLTTVEKPQKKGGFNPMFFVT